MTQDDTEALELMQGRINAHQALKEELQIKLAKFEDQWVKLCRKWVLKEIDEDTFAELKTKNKSERKTIRENIARCEDNLAKFHTEYIDYVNSLEPVVLR